MGETQLEAARARRRGLPAGVQSERLRVELKLLLGNIEPTADSRAELLWKRSLEGVEAEALSLEVEEGIHVPLLLLRPGGRERTPVVVAITRDGKSRFLESCRTEISQLLLAGIAVCLPDVRGTGETSPASEARDGGPRHAIAQMEFDLGQCLVGARLRDLRTVLAYVRSRGDIDVGRLALWGESFAPSNPADLASDELEYEAGPHIQHRAEPMGPHLALLAALFDDDIQAVAAGGSLTSYLSVLEHSFTYIPFEDVIRGIVKVADIADIAAALSPRPLRLERLINGRNILANPSALERTFRSARQSYEQLHAGQKLVIEVERGDTMSWLVEKLTAGTAR